MQARCPHCQGIFTAAQAGIQVCPNCGQQVDVPEVRVAPVALPGAAAPGGSPSPGAPSADSGVRQDTPWERRKELGVWNGLFETWKKTIASPQLFFPTVKPNGSWTDAVFYAWILAAADAVLSVIVSVLGRAQMAAQINQASEMLDKFAPGIPHLHEYIDMAQKRMGHPGIGSLIGGILVIPVGLVIISAFLHVVCLLLGAAKNGYYATLRAFCYASAPVVFQFIASAGVSPLACLGMFVTIWRGVLLVFALASLQEVSVGKAAVAVVIPFVLAVCCACGLAMAVASALFGAASHGSLSV